MTKTMWMVRAGEGGYLIKEFEKGYIAIGWNDIENLTPSTSVDEIKDQYNSAYPEEKPGKIAGSASMIYKFVVSIQKGDKVASYDPSKREYLIGEVVSDYFYKEGEILDYFHLRKVKWVGRIERDLLSPSARNTLGSVLTLFLINEEVTQELLGLLSGIVPKTKEETREEIKVELDQLKEDTVSRAHELIKDKILQLSPEEMEFLAAAVLRAMGYKTRVMPKGPDRGVDVLASPDGLGLEEPRIKVEVKHRTKTQMGSQEIRSFLGGLREGDKALYISTGGFTKDAKYEADRSNIPLTLLNLDDLALLIVNYYESFDVEGKMLIPLTKIYWPAE